MKKFIIITILLTYSIHSFGQQQDEVNVLEADSTWGKEIIQVPFWFAPKIEYKGYEDIRFAKGWEKIDSAGFWTLVFAWDIDLKAKPTPKFFEEHLKLYLDGLMKVVVEDSTTSIPETKANFIKTKEENKITTFTGTLETYDAFTTKKMIVLHVTIESYYCKKTKNYIPLFRMSPKNFDHTIWKEINKIRLSDTLCKN